MTAVLHNSQQLCLLMHFSRDYYFVFAFVPVIYVVIGFPLSSAGAGRWAEVPEVWGSSENPLLTWQQ